MTSNTSLTYIFDSECTFDEGSVISTTHDKEASHIIGVEYIDLLDISELSAEARIDPEIALQEQLRAQLEDVVTSQQQVFIDAFTINEREEVDFNITRN